MLESIRIKAYGKHSVRVVFVPNDRSAHVSPSASQRILPQDNNMKHSPPSTRNSHFPRRKVHGLSTSPRGSPKSSNVLGRAMPKGSKNTITPRRLPLVPKTANVSGTPSAVYLGDKQFISPQPSPTKVSRFTPFVDSGAKGVEKPAVSLGKESEADEPVRPSRKRAQKRIVVTEDEDEEVIPRRTLRGSRAKPIMFSDESSDSFTPIVPPPKTRVTQDPKPRLQQQESTKAKAQHTQAGTSCLDPPKPLVPIPPNPPVARPPSPRRSHRNVLLPSKTQNQAQAVITPVLGADPAIVKPKPKSYVSSKKHTAKNLQYLAPLLAECSQKTPYCFSTFIETFPFDDIHGRKPSVNLSFRKIGEASYSEVFRIGNVVLKIVPLRNESSAKSPVDPNLDLPQESDVKDVLQEVIVTRAMGQICPGFIRLLRSYVVTGVYPSLLLSLWDDFHSVKGSESIRPDAFPQMQAYAVLVLPDGGADLEAYKLPAKTGWRQACSIFWQTAKALATAEDMVSFEHRDLHWGQILVRSAGKDPQNPPASGSIRMDDPLHGVTATIIDLGLARMDAADGRQNSVHWTAFDELIFEGEGDYQFDVYRMMQRLHGDTWEQYRPLTNVMWLHYLLSKLLHAKRLRPPGKRVAIVDGEFSEKQCYECLLDMEQRLGSCISQANGKKGRGGGGKGRFCTAGDVVYFAKERSWVS